MFLPYSKKGAFGIVFGALRVGDFGSFFPFWKSYVSIDDNQYELFDVPASRENSIIR